MRSSFQLGLKKGCYAQNRIVKSVSSIEIQRNVIIKYIPSQVIALDVRKPVARTNATVRVQVDAHFPSGTLYCATFPAKAVGGCLAHSLAH